MIALFQLKNNEPTAMIKKKICMNVDWRSSLTDLIAMSSPMIRPESKPKRWAPRSVRSPELPSIASSAAPAMKGTKNLIPNGWRCSMTWYIESMPIILKTAVEKPTER